MAPKARAFRIPHHEKVPMDIEKPAKMRATILPKGNQLDVIIPYHGKLASLIALATFLGIIMLSDGRPYLYLMIIPWLTWNLFARQVIQFSTTTMRVERKIFGFHFGKDYAKFKIKNLRVDPAYGSGENRHSIYGGLIVFEYDGETRRFASGIEPLEAKYILTRVQHYGFIRKENLEPKIPVHDPGHYDPNESGLARNSDRAGTG